ncbi:hypothetical protein [Streptomyces sp. WMMC905]|uniref:hypothetical protein n=1 Tax=Streptomyces sp. WMMC905 TaxID=3404123 RepID=UPI003B94F70B
MTACAIDPSVDPGVPEGPRAACSITADGAYAARLARRGDARYAERWTLDGPEPYAVPLPRGRPEAPGTGLMPMGDGRVLVHRRGAGRHLFALLYPTGPGTGELPLGVVECPRENPGMRLLPPVSDGTRAYALAHGRHATSVWLVAGGRAGPEPLAEVPGRCSGGVWLDHSARILALDREIDGRTKTVVVDLARGGEVSPLLQIAPDSDDRVLLADPDSGLLVLRSDAPAPGAPPGLGWGVLGSSRPVRFPACLRLPGCTVTPFAIQPGQSLTPERCAVALRLDGPLGSWVAVWRPAERRVHHLRPPRGWLTGGGTWTSDGVLQLPYAATESTCGVARLTPPVPDSAGPAGGGARPGQDGAARPSGTPSARPARVTPARPAGSWPAAWATAGQASAAGVGPRPVPLQQAPLAGLVTN